MIIGLTLKNSLTSSNHVILIVWSLTKFLQKFRKLLDTTSLTKIILTLQSTNYYKQKRPAEIPFVTSWHQKLSGFQSTLHYRYQEMVNDYPELKCVFPAPPILAYRHSRNLGNLLVHTSLTKPTSNTSHLSSYSSPCKSNRRCKL